jgi:hypothetical protein
VGLESSFRECGSARGRSGSAGEGPCCRWPEEKPVDAYLVAAGPLGVLVDRLVVAGLEDVA